MIVASIEDRGGFVEDLAMEAGFPRMVPFG